MIEMEEALERIVSDVERLPARDLPLADCLGRQLARSIVSPRHVPPLANSSMDGFAVRAADTGSTPVTLRVIGSLRAGQAPVEPLLPGTAIRIMTGAPIPPQADAVVKVEDTRPAGEDVRIMVAVDQGNYVRQAGEDLRAGEEVLQAGCTLTPARLGLLASMGFASAPAVRRPRVAILSTGDELVAPGNSLPPGKIYSSNPYALAAQAREAGALPLDRGSAPDELQATRRALRSCLPCDIIITTGGVSVGDHDHVKEALALEGAEQRLWRVAMKPGKPMAYGLFGGSRFFALPGNPVSCMVGFLQWVRPVVRKMLGDPRPFLPVVDAVIEESVRKRPGRAWLERVQLRPGPDGCWLARRTGNQSSGVLRSMANAQGLLLLHRDSAGVDAGEAVRVQLLDWRFMHDARPNYRWRGSD